LNVASVSQRMKKATDEDVGRLSSREANASAPARRILLFELRNSFAWAEFFAAVRAIGAVALLKDNLKESRRSMRTG
jgi:hypothetical protein